MEQGVVGWKDGGGGFGFVEPGQVLGQVQE